MTSETRSNESAIMKKLQTKSALQKKIEEDVLMASKVGDAVWLQQSLSTKQIPLNFTDKDGMSAIHLASLECQHECLKILIEKEHVDVNLQSEDGWTSLHLAINNTMPTQSLKCVEFLISNGANPSSVTSYGITPMHQAAACGNVECLKALIDAGGQVDGIDEADHTPYNLAILWGYRDCARILKHHQWQKNKSSELIVKKQIQHEEAQIIQAEIAAKQKEKAEKRLKGQKAYQLWLAKNQFANNSLFWLDSVDHHFDETGSRLTPMNRHIKQQSLASKGKSRKSTALRTKTSQGKTQSSNKKVTLIPINTPGSPTPGRRLQNDSEKRLPHLPSPARIRAVQKRGPLQFTVI